MPRLTIVPTFPPGLETIELDVTRSLNDELSAQVVNEPVEGESTVTDEVLIDPRMIEVEGIFSNAAPGFAAFFGKARAETMVNKLRATLLAKAIVTLVDPDSTVSRLVLYRVRVSRDRTTGAARAFSLSFQRIKEISFELIQAIGDSDLEALGALGSVDLGLPPP